MSITQSQYLSIALIALFVVGLMLVPDVANAADYLVSPIVTEIKSGEKPVGTVASASITLLAIRRTWKIIRGSI